MPTLQRHQPAGQFGFSASSHPSDLGVTPPPFGRLDLDRTLDCAVEAAPAGFAHDSGPPGQVVRFTEFPRAGITFLGFELVSELGTGAFGKVFLARQLALAGRPVALKVTTRPTTEPEQLAKLHHTNIVPIYSVHDAAPLQAVCMPYLGARTLADVVGPYRSTGIYPATRDGNASTKAQARTTTTRPSLARPSTTPPTVPVPAPRPLAGVFDDMTSAEQVDWVLRTVRGLADGLGHAHDRGILHLDLKPANVLIADDGTPLLLDFNLSKDASAGTRAQTGGTLPYMAPEQLDGFRLRDDTHLDERTDLYGLGVIFYELLTGKDPFPRPTSAVPDLARMALDRRAGPGKVRDHNPAVPRAVESIVETLLQPLPARRYPSAAALVADLTRQLDARPLAFAPEPSLRERVVKWHRRNPRLRSRVLTATLALSVVGLTGGLAYHADARADAVAEDGHRVALAELADLRIELLNRVNPPRRHGALKASADLLARYGLVVGRPWEPTAAFRRLPAAHQRDLAAQCGELCRLNAASVMIPARTRPADEARDLAVEALAWHGLADACYAGPGTPRGLHRERAALLAAAGRPVPPVPDGLTAGDPISEAYLTGVEGFLAGRFAKAVTPLEEVTLEQPTHAAAQFLLAVCRQEMGDYDRAMERFLVVKSLAPENGRASLNRGTIALIQSRADDAEREFADALAREPRLAAGYLYRGIARQALAKFADADADLTHYLGLEPNSARAFQVRAEVRASLGDATGAEADRLSVRRCVPVTPGDFIARGNLRTTDDPAAARQDFLRATELNPQAVTAWQNLAHLAAVRGDFADALAIQDKAVAAAPESATVRVSRAALLATTGKRDLAHADVERALTLGTGPVLHYYAARVYALTTPGHAADADLAVGHLRQAFQFGYRDFAAVAADRTLDAVRDDSGFRDAVLAAKTIWQQPAKVALDD